MINDHSANAKVFTFEVKTKLTQVNKPPTHRELTYFPNSIHITETFPARRAHVKAECRYCYETHSDWWEMRHEDYNARVYLCALCEHASIEDQMNIKEEV